MTGMWRGHEIFMGMGVWKYKDTREPVPDNPNRPCGRCLLPNRADGHDACLGELAGVANACCGHGDFHASYIQFESGLTVRGFLIDGAVE